jgi:hypothetical protein
VLFVKRADPWLHE